MKCPHCNVEINPNFKESFLTSDETGDWSVYYMVCPSPDCKKVIVDLALGEYEYDGTIFKLCNQKSRYTVLPRMSLRPAVPKEVDEKFANDYNEAASILDLSPKASAALSRRCLQNILREKAGVKKGNLADEIQQVISNKQIPSYLSKSIDAVRNVGNFAAHPIKSTATGEIVEVEHGEAEWLLDVLDALFDFYFVQPTLLEEKREALNKKLSEIGKPPMM